MPNANVYLNEDRPLWWLLWPRSLKGAAAGVIVDY